MDNIHEKINLQAIVPEALVGKRLDQALAQLFPDYSRSRIKGWIEQGCVEVNGELKRPRDKVIEGETLVIKAEIETVSNWGAEEIALNIVYEDEHLLIINKPTDFVIHPAAGNWKGTLVNALLYKYPNLNQLPRAGIVHRLDKDTTGLMVIAKTMTAHTALVNALQQRKIKRIYEAVVKGVVVSGGTIDAPLGRHTKDRKKRAVTTNGKPAITHYRIIEKFKGHTHLRIQLETGRTHQIRVHMTYHYHPIVGDKMYGRYGLNLFPRQALHAKELALIHPITKEELRFEVPLPIDMLQLLQRLRAI